jgi:hypothetical protein
VLVLAPEHVAVFAAAGRDRARFAAELDALLLLPPEELAHGASGIEEGVPAPRGPRPKFRPGGLMVAVAGGGAGKFSTVLGGWVGGPGGSTPVTRVVEEADQ